jgi:hypothetical protein
MKQKQLEHLFEEHNAQELSWEGLCHDCKKECIVTAKRTKDGIDIEGGALYQPDDEVYIKCDSCFDNNRILTNFRKNSVYSRVVGYLRPVDAWNKAKQTEFHARKNYACPVS